MEKNAIKRVPILENGQLVGIVSRANLIQAVATARSLLEIPLSDATIRDKILCCLKEQPWAHTSLLNVTVNGGIVDLWHCRIRYRTKGHQSRCRVHARSARGQ
jgi:signal-transduction protein with cAMP-binding, CBS, and nucleotidyltransferase domain